MRVKPKLLVPGVQNGDCPGLCAEQFRVFGKQTKGFPRFFEQQVVHHLAVETEQLQQIMRNSKYHMKIFDRQQFLFAVPPPTTLCRYPDNADSGGYGNCATRNAPNHNRCIPWPNHPVPGCGSQPVHAVFLAGVSKRLFSATSPVETDLQLLPTYYREPFP